jgi:hypothetical protein
MDKDDAKRIEALEQRVGALEKAFTQTDKPDRNIVELDLTLPEADIDGLHFTEQKVHAVFEKRDDGWYYSRDILFHSARDTDEGTGRDILLEYLESDAVKEAFCACLDTDTESYFSEIEISLPRKNQGIKKYNGVDWWHWLADPYSGSAAYFCLVYHGGHAGHSGASAVGGCAPAFRVAERHG